MLVVRLGSRCPYLGCWVLVVLRGCWVSALLVVVWCCLSDFGNFGVGFLIGLGCYVGLGLLVRLLLVGYRLRFRVAGLVFRFRAWGVRSRVLIQVSHATIRVFRV